MENYQQKIDELLRKARAQGAARAARVKKRFVTNIVVTEEKPKEELKSLKDIWRSMDSLDSKNPMSTRFRKTAKDKKSKKSKKLSSGNKNHRTDWQSYHTNTENIPVQTFIGFHRNKTSPLLEKCKADTSFQFAKKYTSPTTSPGSDQSPDSSPLKNVKKPAITNYFQRREIKTDYSPSTVRSDTISPDTIRSDTISPETEYMMDFSSEHSSFMTTSSGEHEDVLMMSAASTPGKVLSDDETMMIFSDSSPEVTSAKKGKAPVFKVAKNATTTRVRLPFVTIDQTLEQTPDHGITPPNRNALIGYFHKGKRQQKSTEFVAGDKLNDVSPDTLRIIAAAQSNGEFGLREYNLPNPFI